MGLDFSQVDRLAADLAKAPAVVTKRAEGDVRSTVDAIARDAKASAPVRTGKLKGRIRATHEALSGEVSSDTEYDSYVEYGTSDTAPQPFMRPAFDRNAPRLDTKLGDSGEDIL